MPPLSMVDVVESWKKYALRPNDLVFVEVVRTIGRPESRVEAMRVDDDWVLVIKGTKEPAVMAFAGIFAKADPYDTGNLVKRPKKAANSVAKGDSTEEEDDGNGRMQHYASFKCNYAYALDTRADREIWELQSALDDYMQSLPDFNDRAVNRSKWQTGLYQDSSKKYWFKVPMFIRVGDDEESPEPPAKLHRWVQAADKRSDMYRANPARSEVWARTDKGTTTPISKTVERVLLPGDAVVVTFMVRYQVNRTWGPQLLLKEITRVMPRSAATAVEHAIQSGTGPVMDTSARQGMIDGEFVPGPPELTVLMDALSGERGADESTATSPPAMSSSGLSLNSVAGPSTEAMDVDKAVVAVEAGAGVVLERPVTETDGSFGRRSADSAELESDGSRSTVDEEASDLEVGRGKRRRVGDKSVVGGNVGTRARGRRR